MTEQHRKYKMLMTKLCLLFAMAAPVFAEVSPADLGVIAKINPGDKTSSGVLASRMLSQPKVIQNKDLTPALITMQETEGGVSLDNKKILSLRDAILLALRNNPDVLNQEIDRITQKYNVRLAQWNFDWQYNLKGQLNFTANKVDGKKTDIINNQVISPQVSKKFATGGEVKIDLDTQIEGLHQNPRIIFSVNQPLWRGAKKDVVMKGLYDAQDNEVLARLQLRQSIMQLVNTIIFDYLALIQSNNQIQTAQRSLQDAKKTYENNAVQIRLGKLPRTSNVTQMAQVESLNLQLVEAKNTKNRSRQQLLKDMGLNPMKQIDVPNDIDIKEVESPTLNQAVKFGLKTNTAYITQLVMMKLSQRNLVKAQDDMLPSLNLTAHAIAGGGTNGGGDAGFSGITNGRNHNESVSLNLSVPINDISLKSSLTRAKIQIDKDKTNLMTAQRNLVLTISNLLTDLKSAALQIDIANRSVKLKQEDYELQVKKQQLGRGTSLDVTTSQNSLISASEALIGAKIQYIRTLASLREALGLTLAYWKIKIRY